MDNDSFRNILSYTGRHQDYSSRYKFNFFILHFENNNFAFTLLSHSKKLYMGSTFFSTGSVHKKGSTKLKIVSPILIQKKHEKNDWIIAFHEDFWKNSGCDLEIKRMSFHKNISCKQKSFIVIQAALINIIYCQASYTVFESVFKHSY